MDPITALKIASTVGGLFYSNKLRQEAKGRNRELSRSIDEQVSNLEGTLPSIDEFTEGLMDLEMDEMSKDFGTEIEYLCNEEIAANRPIEVSFIAREDAILDRDLIRTKINLVPESIKEIRIVDIVGLDKQADGGTHVSSTSQVGRMEIVKTESKGKGFKRIRFVVHNE